jgi:hypothetical protein
MSPPCSLPQPDLSGPTINNRARVVAQRSWCPSHPRYRSATWRARHARRLTPYPLRPPPCHRAVLRAFAFSATASVLSQTMSPQDWEPLPPLAQHN